MLNILIHWFLSALIISGVAYLLPNMYVNGIGAALFAALILGLVNAIIRPVLSFLTFPINMLTFGLFSFVVNALMLSLTASLVPGFKIEGFLTALLGAVLLALLNAVLLNVTEHFDGKKSLPRKY
jgi:putative membrane protein